MQCIFQQKIILLPSSLPFFFPSLVSVVTFLLMWCLDLVSWSCPWPHLVPTTKARSLQKQITRSLEKQKTNNVKPSTSNFATSLLLTSHNLVDHRHGCTPLCIVMSSNDLPERGRGEQLTSTSSQSKESCKFERTKAFNCALLCLISISCVNNIVNQLRFKPLPPLRCWILSCKQYLCRGQLALYFNTQWYQWVGFVLLHWCWWFQLPFAQVMKCILAPI
jgi:hypothetical protein